MEKLPNSLFKKCGKSVIQIWKNSLKTPTIHCAPFFLFFTSVHIYIFSFQVRMTFQPESPEQFQQMFRSMVQVVAKLYTQAQRPSSTTLLQSSPSLCHLNVMIPLLKPNNYPVSHPVAHQHLKSLLYKIRVLQKTCQAFTHDINLQTTTWEM